MTNANAIEVISKELLGKDSWIYTECGYSLSPECVAALNQAISALRHIDAIVEDNHRLRVDLACQIPPPQLIVDISQVAPDMQAQILENATHYMSVDLADESMQNG